MSQLGRRFYDDVECMICNVTLDDEKYHACAVMRVDEPRLIACGACIEDALRETYGNDTWMEQGL